MAKEKKKNMKKTSTAGEALTKFKMEAAREVDLSLKQESDKPANCDRKSSKSVKAQTKGN